MEKYLSDLDIKIYIYLDNEQDLNSVAPSVKEPPFSCAGVMLELQRYLKKISVLEFDGENYNVILKDNRISFGNGQKEFWTDEESLQKYLDEIIKDEIFTVKKNNRELEFKLTANLFSKLGLLSKVLIREENGDFSERYRLNGGAYRTFNEKTSAPKNINCHSSTIYNRKMRIKS